MWQSFIEVFASVGISRATPYWENDLGRTGPRWNEFSLKGCWLGPYGGGERGFTLRFYVWSQRGEGEQLTCLSMH